MIEAESGFCEQVSRVYHQCVWCLEEEAMEECSLNSFWVKCGDQPSRTELVEDPTYRYFTTDDDIDRFCEELESSYNVTLLKSTEAWLPATKQLCEKQNQAKQHCPGYCDGGCFDGPTGIPPSCLEDRYPGPFNTSLKTWQMCKEMDYDILFWMPPEDILNISKQADYLRAIPENTAICDEYQQAYHDCYWCATDRCFTDEDPPSCERQDVTLPAETVESVCEFIYGPLYNGFVDDKAATFNASLHSQHLFFGNNTEFCELARNHYHQCQFCHQDGYAKNFCVAGSWCNSEAIIPKDFALVGDDAIFNLTSGLSCMEIKELWSQNWEDTFLLDRCYRNMFVHRQCPVEFCNYDVPSFPYLGATTRAQKLSLIWMSRSAAILSFCGALYIIYDCRSTFSRRSSVYYQLLFAMAVFDIITAFAWSFASAPLDTEYGGYVVGAIGNEATCTAQGFFIQLGFTSIYYNVSLSVYYVLLIGYNWKESMLRKL